MSRIYTRTSLDLLHVSVNNNMDMIKISHVMTVYTIKSFCVCV